MLVGAGALDAQDEVLQIAELLGAGIAKSWLGKAVVPDDVPFCTGHIGLLGSKPSWDLMQDCDTLLVVGCSFPYAEFYPKAGQAKAVQIDIDGRLLSLRYPMDVNLKGDAKQTLAALMPLLAPQDRSQPGRRRSSTDVQGLVEGRRSAGAHRRQQRPAQSRARLLGTQPQAARRLHPLRRQRHDRQLVRPRPENPPRHDGQRQRQPRHDGRGRSLRRRRQVLLSRSRLHRRHRRRRDADERPQRLHHRRQVLEGMVRPALDHAGAQQPRPQPGDLGTADHDGRHPASSPARSCPISPMPRFAESIGLRGIRVEKPEQTWPTPGTAP